MGYDEYLDACVNDAFVSMEECEIAAENDSGYNLLDCLNELVGKDLDLTPQEAYDTFWELKEMEDDLDIDLGVWNAWEKHYERQKEWQYQEMYDEEW